MTDEELNKLVRDQAQVFVKSVKDRKFSKPEKYYYGIVGGSIVFVSNAGKVLFTKKGDISIAFRNSKMLQAFHTLCTVNVFSKKYPKLYENGNFFNTEEYWQTRREVKKYIDNNNPLDLQIFEKNPLQDD